MHLAAVLRYSSAGQLQVVLLRRGTTVGVSSLPKCRRKAKGAHERVAYNSIDRN
jgi:hypothetical protein